MENKKNESLIKIDDKEYILKSEYDELQKEFKEFKSKNDKKNIHIPCKILVDIPNVLGLGCVRLSEDYFRVKFSRDYLEKVNTILKEFDYESVTFALAKDMPLVAGMYNEKTNEVTGVILAPRVENDE